jgi:hypothetical protein
MGLTLVQNRYTATVSDTTKYYVQSSITDKGPLQDTSVFVMSIADVADPNQDSFERIATVADFADFPNNRDDAVSAGKNLFRVPDVTIEYSDLVSANDGAKKFQEDVDKLLTDWNLYYNEFYATNDTIPLPLTDPATLTQLITTYTQAVTATATALADNTTAQTAQKQAQDAVTQADSEFNDSEEILTAVRNLTNKITPYEAGVDDLKTLTSTVGDGPPSGFGSVEHEGSNFLRELNRFMYWVKQTVTDIQNELNQTTPNTTTIQTKLNLLWDMSAGTGAYIDFINSGYSPTFLQSTNDSIKNGSLPKALSAKDISVDTAVVDTHYENARDALGTAKATLTSATITAKEKEAAYLKAQEDEAAALKAVTDVYPQFDPTNPVPPS